MSKEHEDLPIEGIDPNKLKRLSFTDWIAVFLGVALIAVVGANVFFRYILDTGIDWSDEVARIIFVWIVFIGSYIAFKHNSHAAVHVLRSKLPAKLKRYHTLFIALLEVAFMILLVWYGTVLVLNTNKFGQVTAGLGVPMSWFYMVIPVTALMMAINLLITAIREFKNEGRTK